MLSGPGQFAENETNEVNFREIPSHVLTKLCQYFAYKFYYTGTAREVPEFHIPQKLLSNYLWLQISWIAKTRRGEGP